MLNTPLKSAWLIGAWLGAVAIIVAASMAMGANLSTTVLLIALGIAPAIVIALLAHGAPSPTAAQILYSVDTKDSGR